MRILPVASGKGGVGKSLLSANLAIALAQAEKKVVLADLDLGGSNLHLILGQQGVSGGLGTYINDSSAKLEDLLVSTGYNGLMFIPGEAEIPGMANLKASYKKRIMNNLMNLDCDYLIMDLGAGTSFNTMDFFLMSGSGIIVSTPALTATLNAYLFLKNAVFRIMTSSFAKESKAYQYLESLRKDGKALQKVYIPKLIENVGKIDPESHKKFTESIQYFRPRLIMNMLEDPKDVNRATKLRHSSREYLGIDVEHLGISYRDDLQANALSSRLPILIYKPKSVLSQAIYRIADKLMETEAIEDHGAIGFSTMDDSYQVAEVEAQADFASKMTYVEDLLHCGALTTGELVETIKTQQYEINQLKRENRFYKHKLVKAARQGYKI